MESAAQEEIQRRLSGTHLSEAPKAPPSTDELRAQVEADTSIMEAEPPTEEADPRHEREWTFPFSWRDGRNKLWVGRFTHTIPSIGERIQLGVLEGRLLGGTNAEAIDPLTRELAMIVAHFTFCLKALDTDWAKDWRTLENPGLLQQLWSEVASHEAIFFGLRKAPTEGKA